MPAGPKMLFHWQIVDRLEKAGKEHFEKERNSFVATNQILLQNRLVKAESQISFLLKKAGVFEQLFNDMNTMFIMVENRLTKSDESLEYHIGQNEELKESVDTITEQSKRQEEELKSLKSKEQVFNAKQKTLVKNIKDLKDKYSHVDTTNSLEVDEIWNMENGKKQQVIHEEKNNDSVIGDLTDQLRLYLMNSDVLDKDTSDITETECQQYSTSESEAQIVHNSVSTNLQLEKTGSKKDESRKEESKKEESKKDESMKEESKKEESKTDKSKKEESKKEESKNDNTKKDESNKYESKKEESKTGLRPIVIDGSNVAFCHGKDKEFSPEGINIVINYFRDRGHADIVVYAPEFREREKHTSNPDLMKELKDNKYLFYTPDKSSDDDFILRRAAKYGGVVVSRDKFRNYADVKEYDEVITNRLLKPAFVKGDLEFPVDPLGNILEEFLNF